MIENVRERGIYPIGFLLHDITISAYGPHVKSSLMRNNGGYC